jgi:hypothetical protein
MLPSAGYCRHLPADYAVDAVRDVVVLEAAETVTAMHSVAHTPHTVAAADDERYVAA